MTVGKRVLADVTNAGSRAEEIILDYPDRSEGSEMRFLLDEGGSKPWDRVLIRHRRGKTWTQRRSHVEMEAETGGRRPPAQGQMPGAPGSWKRQGGPSLGASAGSSALGHHDHLRTVSRAGGGWMSVVFSHPFGVLSYSCPRTLV